MKAIQLTGTALLLTSVHCAFIPRDTPHFCAAEVDYTVAKQEQFKRDPFEAAGTRCGSTTETCQLAREYSHEVTVEESISFGLSSSLDLGKIREIGSGIGAGIDLGAEFSWSTTDGTATSATVTCPAGGYICGLSITEHYIKITGQQCSRGVTDQKPCPRGTDGMKCANYTVYAPETVSNAPSNQATIVDFTACLAECETTDAPGSCSDPAVANMKKCNANPAPLPT